MGTKLNDARIVRLTNFEKFFFQKGMHGRKGTFFSSRTLANNTEFGREFVSLLTSDVEASEMRLIFG